MLWLLAIHIEYISYLTQTINNDMWHAIFSTVNTLLELLLLLLCKNYENIVKNTEGVCAHKVQSFTDDQAVTVLEQEDGVCGV